MTKCLLCERVHGEIYQRFTDYIIPDLIGPKECEKFLRAIEFELNENNWNEVYCFISNIVKQKSYIHANICSNLIWKLCVNLEEIMRTNPGNNSIKEISKLNIISEEIGHMPGYTKRVKEEISLKEIDQEIDTLRKILRNLEKDKDTEEALKNYLILRLISFYERWVHDTLVKEIDLLPKENQRSLFDREVKINPDDLLKLDGLTVGRLAVSGLDNSPNSLNYIILRLLKAKYSNSKIRINDKFNFFNFLDYSTDILHPTLKTAHQSSGSWFQLVKNLNLQRNSIVHELRSTDMSNESILQSFILFQGFFKIFPALVRLLLYTNDPDYSKEDLVKHYGSLSDEIFKTKSFDELNGKIKNDLFVQNNSNNNRR